MRLPNITKGPITLSRIDYAASLSEETVAFSAVIEINGLKGTVSNDGHGGCNFVHPRSVLDAVVAYAKTLPQWSDFGMTGDETYDTVIGGMIGRAVDEYEAQKVRKRMLRKGFKYEAICGHRAYYLKDAPTTPWLNKTFGADVASVRVSAL
mgnify:CR=1 FL=1